VLNGIGGRTVEEAKQRITPAEFSQWVAFINQFGSINPNRRMELGFAMIAQQINNALGGQKTMADFMPHHKPEHSALTFEQAMEMWS
jgi:DNA-binding transcriptional regulator LsrR (DeoR family)